MPLLVGAAGCSSSPPATSGSVVTIFGSVADEAVATP